jgi:diguanylate cyclase (GGDEF)-like protein
VARRGRKKEQGDEATRRADLVLAAAAAAAVPAADYALLLGSYRELLEKFHAVMRISDSYSAELKTAADQLEQLRSLTLPICMFCKKIRNDDDYWEQIEGYFAKHVDIAFTHGICPDCMQARYGSLLDTGATKDQIAKDVAEMAERRGAGNVPDEDEAVRAAERVLALAKSSPDRLQAGMRTLLDRYRRLLRRMGKILLISDGYQARLMDMNSRLHLLARTDGLMGISNRLDAMEKLEAERSRVERHGGIFSIAIADIDDFKAINDSHGHEAGDRVLSSVGRVLRSAMRREDTCARWGGEEFLFLLPETDLQAAESLVGKLLEAVRELTVTCEGATLRCTLSAGFTSFSAGRTVDDMLREADAGLYSAKRLGKNRAVRAES